MINLIVYFEEFAANLVILKLILRLVKYLNLVSRNNGDIASYFIELLSHKLGVLFL